MRVGFFACPSVSRVSPATISPSFECVEILTGGKLYFEVNGERRLFERGAVFWHSEGEHTICETDANDPYRCFVLYFRVGDNRRPGPRASVWDPPESAVDFATECHKAFHAGGADMEALSDYAYSTITEGDPAGIDGAQTHRALSDARMASHLMIRMFRDGTYEP